MTMRWCVRAIVGCAIIFFAADSRASAATVLYLEKAGVQGDTRQQIETAANFYGLDLDARSAEGGSAVQGLAASKIVAIILDASALTTINRADILRFAHSGVRPIPILIAGIDANSSPAQLRLWSSGAVIGSRRNFVWTAGFYQVGFVNDVTRQLANVKLPLGQHQLDYLVAKDAEYLIHAAFAGSSVPIFMRTGSGADEVFFSAEVKSSVIPVTPDPYRQQSVFANIAAPMMFLRYAAGDRAWHSPATYANFTIDDLWLREPYGHVNFEALLQHAQQHNFHATVAFIPWNYKRSQSGMVTLFRQHPDRLSISVHGNNHVHQEFGPFDKHPLNTQQENIQQALTRMDRFKEITGIPYDAVMVFPHSISPEGTLAALKRANFIATANSLNVPSDALAPVDARFALRTSSLRFANFLSLRRYSAESEIPSAQLAIDAFLGNPMLFYAHESFFTSGMNAFDPVADVVNGLAPDTQWRSLGDIVQHLYVEKVRDDGNFDVCLSSSYVRLSNYHEQAATFYLEKEEDFSLPVTVLVDGKPEQYLRDERKLLIRLTIAKGDSKFIQIKYGSGRTPVSPASSSTSLGVATIRLLSDFRDNVVSTTGLGRWFIRLSADRELTWKRTAAALAALPGVIFGWLYLRRNARLPAPDSANNL
jgi:hypothetical protein